jgi:hypothetical protein
MGTREFTVALQADGTYRMQSPTRSAPEDSGHWAVQGKHMLWRSTRRQSAEMDINRIVANDGQRLELIEAHGVHSHFERRADLPPLRCEP